MPAPIPLPWNPCPDAPSLDCGDAPDPARLLLLGAVGLTVAYGIARMSTVFFGEMRDWVFVRVGQRALRKLAYETFTHIHRLSLRYHITRKTGGLSRIIERGVKGVDFLLRFMLFSIGPLILELSMVSVLFAVLFGWQYMVVVVVTTTSAVLVTALSAALSWGPGHAWAWLDLPTQIGMLAGAGLALLLVLVSWRVSAAVALLALGVYLSLLNQAPESPYFAQTLQLWEQGRFIRFNGLAQWVGWLWPYVASLYLLGQIARRDTKT